MFISTILFSMRMGGQTNKYEKAKEYLIILVHITEYYKKEM